MSTTSEEFFDAMYQRDGDPWNFAADPYERQRYGRILEAVGAGPYRRVFEPGCSIGELTRLLAPRCGHLLASDISATAAAAAASRCAEMSQVTVVHADLANQLPDGTFDLIVFSEIGYYFTRRRLAGVIDRLVDRLDHPGRLVAAHWTGRSPDHVLSGETVHRTIGDNDRLEPIISEIRPGYVLGVWLRRPA